LSTPTRTARVGSVRSRRVEQSDYDALLDAAAYEALTTN
jgi:hypothetical protein